MDTNNDYSTQASTGIASQNYIPQGSVNDPNANVPPSDKDETTCNPKLIIAVIIGLIVVTGAVVGAVCGSGNCGKKEEGTANSVTGPTTPSPSLPVASTTSPTISSSTLFPTRFPTSLSPTSPPSLRPITNNPEDPPEIQTLQKVLTNGVLRCGVESSEGFSADLCRAVAAAVLGPEYSVEFTVVTPLNRFILLQNDQVDILAARVTHTMERDLLEPTSGFGFSFSIPYLYDGLTFAGLPEFVDCADDLDGTSGNCTTLRVCVESGTTHEAKLPDLLPNTNLIRSQSFSQSFQNFRQSLCQVLAGEQFVVAESVARSLGYDGDYAVGKNLYSKEPLSLVTRDGDTNWADFVNWVLEGIIHADEIQITQTNAGLLTTSELFGSEFSNMFVDAVSAVGNYGELYDRHFEDIVPREGGPNTINEGTSGLIYSMPFGDLSGIGPTPSANSTLQIIKDRGFLRCGISRRAIFAVEDTDTGAWSGQDVDFCRAISAAIFEGVTDTVEFENLSAADRFVALQNGNVDVLSRITTVTFSRDVLEPATGEPFSFAQPNFYDGLTFGGIPPFGNCADTLDTVSSACQGLRICVNQATTFFSRLQDIFPNENIVPRESGAAAAQGLSDGACNAVAGGIIDVSRTNIEGIGNYIGDYEIGSSRLTKDPLALVTRQDDQQWSAFVYWVNSALVYAEEEGISSSNFLTMPRVNLFGQDFSRMLQDTLLAVGNYEDIYNRNVQDDVPRGGLNVLNFKPLGPQLYALPGL